MLSSTDEKLIKEVAEIWVDGGGDANGIYFCWMDIANAVANEITKRNDLKDKDGT